MSFARRGYATFLTPIEVPVGYDPGALEWWQDTNTSEPELEVQPHLQTHRYPDREHEECDNGNGICSQTDQHHHHRRLVEPHHVRIPDELNNPTELRRRAIADSIIRNMRLWNSDSESFSEVSSDEEKSSESWVTEEEQVIIGGSDMQEAEQVDKNERCDVPSVVVTMVTQSQSESGMESAESWFTSSDNSHSQIERGEVLDQHNTKTRHCEHNLGETSSLLLTRPTEAHVGEAPCKPERGSVCSSICTDDSLAWETACEDLPSQVN